MIKNPIFITIAISIWLIATGIIAFHQIRGPSPELSLQETARAEIRERAALATLREQHAHERTLKQMDMVQAAYAKNSKGGAEEVAFSLCLWVLTLLGAIFILYLEIQNLRKDIREVRKQARPEPRTQLFISYADLQQAGFLPEKTKGKDLHVLSLRASERRT